MEICSAFYTEVHLYLMHGLVIKYNSPKAVALVRLSNGRFAKMHAAAFISGRPARLPIVGDNIKCQISNEHTGVITVARLR